MPPRHVRVEDDLLAAILEACARASVGELSARVPLDERALESEAPMAELARALNVLLSDLEHRHERLLREQARLRSVFDALPAAILTTEPSGTAIAYANAFAERMLGLPWTPDLRLGDYFVHWERCDQDGHVLRDDESHILTALATRRPTTPRVVLMRPRTERMREHLRAQGREHLVVRARALPLLTEEGETRGAILVLEDVSGEEERKRALDDQRHLYETLLRAQSDMGEGAVLLQAGRVLHANEAFLNLLGYTLAEVRDPAFDLRSVCEPERPGGAIPFGADTDPAEQVPAQYQVKVRTKRDEQVTLDIVSKPVVLNGQDHRVAIVRDVTHQVRLREQLDAARATIAAHERLAVLGSLVSGVAHEVRTPLTFLANNAFLLGRRLTQAAERDASAKEALQDAAPFLDEIEIGIDRVNQLVEDLRRYTKAGLADETTVDALGNLIVDAIELFRATNRTRSPVETSLSPTPPIRANRGALQQLVLNLLQNAADASPNLEPIRVVTREEGDLAVLEIVDHGTGMPDWVQKRMFDPLFTTKPDGTGLGLSIVKRIADDHHATVVCESRAGSGTRFRILFPAAGPR